MASGTWGRHYDLTDISRMLGYSSVHQAGRYARFVETQLGTGVVAKVRRDLMAPNNATTSGRAFFTPTLASGTGAEPNATNAEYTLADCAFDTHKEESEILRWVRAIERKRQIVLAGPPGTGKTFCAERLARHLMSGGTGLTELVQFHPSYAYEDFIQGIRPETTGDGSLVYPLVAGRFVDFCRRASGRDRSVLIIDEINRANLARVFGELLYLLEYRTQSIPLAGGNPFRIPENVVIVGTMNTADRSIALMDHALRRRFAFVTLAPDMASLSTFHQRHATGFDTEPLVGLLRRVNRTIDDPHYAIGVSFFMSTDLAANGVLEDVWRLEIEPYLEELFFDQPAKVSAFRWDSVKAELAR